jgi:hypothetical protein
MTRASRGATRNRARVWGTQREAGAALVMKDWVMGFLLQR